MEIKGFIFDTCKPSKSMKMSPFVWRSKASLLWVHGA